MIAAPANTISLSVALLWEITIKHALVRGSANDLPVSGADALQYFRGAGYEILTITAVHVVAVASLPQHHRDPFDRLLAAQAAVETLQLIASDQQLAAYGGMVIVV